MRNLVGQGKKMRAFAISSMANTRKPVDEGNSPKQKSHWASTGNLRSSPSLHSEQVVRACCATTQC